MFTAAGGLAGELCVRCHKTEALKVFAAMGPDLATGITGEEDLLPAYFAAFTASVIDRRDRWSIDGAPPTRLFIGWKENTLMRFNAARGWSSSTPISPPRRRQFMGLDVYVVDAESFLEVMA